MDLLPYPALEEIENCLLPFPAHEVEGISHIELRFRKSTPTSDHEFGFNFGLRYQDVTIPVTSRITHHVVVSDETE